MGRIKVTRKGYTRKDGTRVKATTYYTKDKGKKGRTPKSKRWAKFETETGWKKSQKTSTRRSKMLASTDKRLSMHDRYVQAGRKLNQLANVTTDKPTEKKARSDANYFFRKAKGR